MSSAHNDLNKQPGLVLRDRDAIVTHDRLARLFLNQNALELGPRVMRTASVRAVAPVSTFPLAAERNNNLFAGIQVSFANQELTRESPQRDLRTSRPEGQRGLRASYQKCARRQWLQSDDDGPDQA